MTVRWLAGMSRQGEKIVRFRYRLVEGPLESPKAKQRVRQLAGSHQKRKKRRADGAAATSPALILQSWSYDRIQDSKAMLRTE